MAGAPLTMRNASTINYADVSWDVPFAKKNRSLNVEGIVRRIRVAKPLSLYYSSHSRI